MNHLMKVFDLCVLVASFFTAIIMVNSSPTAIRLSAVLALPIRLGNCLIFAAMVVVWHELFVLCGLYVSKRLTSRKAQVFEVCKATMLAAGFLFLCGKFFHIAMIRPLFVASFTIVCAILLASGRLIACSLLIALRRNGKNSRFVLIVGTNERAIRFASEITERREFGYKIVGFVDDDWAGIGTFESTTGFKRRCNFDGLADFLRHNVVDEAALYLPVRSYYEHASQLVSLCEQHGIVIRYDSQIFNLRTLPSQVPELDQNSPASAAPSTRETGHAVVKRALDLVLSLALLIILAPVFLIVSLLLKFTSSGPVFFSQTRLGLNKRQFKIYKFRTMVANAEKLQEQMLEMNEMSGPAFKIKNDPRVTPIGRTLRKTSIDELPQLLNVLFGDMSLVGPRAMSLRDYKLFDKDWQRRRFSVKPGITCLWQVQGRSLLPFEQWMELDMQYIDRWSLWLDLKILLQTLPAVLRGTGAA